MRSQKLTFSTKNSMFGTTVILENKSQKTQDCILENVDFNPLDNHTTSIKEGYQFRSPNVKSDDWYDILSGLGNIEGPYNLWAQKNDNVVNCFVVFQEKSDAAIFSLGNTVHWQKWSDEKESAEKADLKTKKKKPKLKVNKDGSVTVKVTVETLKKI